MITKTPRFLNDVETQEFLEIFNPDNDLLNSDIVKYFGKRVKKDGKNIGVENPIFYTNDKIRIYKGFLKGIDKEIVTTLGKYIINYHCLSHVIEHFGFIQDNMNKKVISKIHDKFIKLIRAGTLTTEDFMKYQDRIVWLGYRTELFTPGISLKFLAPDKEVMALKKKLIKEKAEIFENNDAVRFVNEIEKPLLDLAKKNLMDDESWVLYERGGKPKFDNTHKNNVVITGPVYDPVSGKYNIIKGSLSDGITPEEYSDYANMIREANHSRGVATQDGGAAVKYFFDAMQTVTLDITKGSNCGTKRYLTVYNLSEEDAVEYVYEGRYIIEGEKIVKLTEENYKNYIGKTIKLRSPMFCKNRKYCNICAGDSKYELNFKNVGLLLPRGSSSVMKLSLKAMHDITLHTVTIDPFAYIQQE